jgi:hypothetical protein
MDSTLAAALAADLQLQHADGLDLHTFYKCTPLELYKFDMLMKTIPYNSILFLLRLAIERNKHREFLINYPYYHGIIKPNLLYYSCPCKLHSENIPNSIKIVEVNYLQKHKYRQISSIVVFFNNFYRREVELGLDSDEILCNPLLYLSHRLRCALDHQELLEYLTYAHNIRVSTYGSLQTGAGIRRYVIMTDEDEDTEFHDIASVISQYGPCNLGISRYTNSPYSLQKMCSFFICHYFINDLLFIKYLIPNHLFIVMLESGFHEHYKWTPSMNSLKNYNILLPKIEKMLK